MSEYLFEKTFENQIFGKEALNRTEYESCSFINCTFSGCNFIGVTFIECVFDKCNFNNAQVNHTAFRTVNFMKCKIKEVNFAMSDKLIFEIAFTDCIMDFSKFYALKMKGTNFVNCSLVAVDFMQTDLTDAIFDTCDLYRAEFEKAIANKADFKTSYNYTIDPTTTKIKRAIFSKENVKGLLFRHDLEIV
jgi:uncharacterized protein YjbI with pentapeptide repeats